MPKAIILILLGICGCTSLHHSSTAAKAPVRVVITQPADTLAALAEKYYGASEYAGLIAYHNQLPKDSLDSGIKVELPVIDELVYALSALKPHQEIVNEILRGRASFAASVQDLRTVRAGVAPGVDEAVPASLQKDLALAADQFERAGDMLAALRQTGDGYPERVHTAIEMVVEEIRVHASGRYYTRRLTIRQTERQLARIFAELLTWQRVLSDELPPEKLAYPRCRCG